MASLFPELEPPIETTTDIKEKEKLYSNTLKFDFLEGDFVCKNGKPIIISDIEALKQRIEKVLKTEAEKYPIYLLDNEPYGTDYPDTTDRTIPLEFIETEFEREITDVLMRDSEIIAVSNFVFSYVARKIMIEFIVHTENKDVEMQLAL